MVIGNFCLSHIKFLMHVAMNVINNSHGSNILVY